MEPSQPSQPSAESCALVLESVGVCVCVRGHKSPFNRVCVKSHVSADKLLNLYYYTIRASSSFRRLTQI